MQLLFVILILALAIGYVAWRIYRILKTPSDPCTGCEGCALKKNCKIIRK
jgi:hypothetical protein